MLSAPRLAELAHACGFDLVGFARAEPIPPQVLTDWIAAGYHADLQWLARQVDARLDVNQLLPGARTVMALACNAWWEDQPSLVARYARGRDYHLTMRDRLRALRRRLRQEFPGLADYGSVDANPVMEKVWAVRAGLGHVGKNGCLITPQFGSWVLLAAMILNQEVDQYARPATDQCASCQLCLSACPTGAIVSPAVVDARRCLSYQTIENEGPVPEVLRTELSTTVFGCDVCQDVCPLNQRPVRADPRFAPRAVAALSAEAFAAMDDQSYAALVPGTPLGRAGLSGLQRNAAYVLGARREAEARATLERLAESAQSSAVREAARWALERLR